MNTDCMKCHSLALLLLASNLVAIAMMAAQTNTMPEAHGVLPEKGLGKHSFLYAKRVK